MGPSGPVPPLAPDELVSTSGERQVLEAFLDLYRASRQVASSFSLDDCVPHARMGQVSLRWIYVHMIEESARHAGHADILREQTDGATGFDG